MEEEGSLDAQDSCDEHELLPTGEATGTDKPSQDPPVQENEETDEANQLEPIEVVRGWSEALKSPTTMARFSPSLNINQDESLHGLGLQLATERSKLIWRFGRRMTAFFTEVACVYETFGGALFKATQSIHNDALFLPEPLCDDSKHFYEAIRAFAVEARRLAEFYRTRIVSRYQTSLTTNRTAIDTSNQRYVAARSQSYESRQRALAARRKYVQLVREAEKAFVDWTIARRNPSPEEAESAPSDANADPLPWELVLKHKGKKVPGATDHLIFKLKLVLASQSQYEQLVKKENEAVVHAQQMEISALEEFQKVEQDRIRFFLDSIVSLICNVEKEMLQGVQVTPQVLVPMPEDESVAVALEKKGKDLLANLFIKPINSFEEGSGRMDAETLGLPEAIGSLREGVKSKVAAREARIKGTQILGNFLEQFTIAASRMAVGLKKITAPPQHQVQRSSLGAEPLRELATKTVGPKASNIWGHVMSIFEDEAGTMLEVAKIAKKLKQEKLDRFLQTAERDLKNQNDTDDNNWKHLCETSRMESRVAARYRQTKLHHEKAREKVLSVDIQLDGKSDDGSEGASSVKPDELLDLGQQPQNRMSRAFLAGGEAMKKLQGNAMLAIAKNNLQEADQKVSKEQQAFYDAAAAKNRAIAEYKNVTETRIKNFESVDQQGFEDLSEMFDCLKKAVKSVKAGRRESLEKPLSGGSITFGFLMADVEEWVESTHKEIKHSCKTISKADSAPAQDGPSLSPQDGYKLEFALFQSDSIDKLISLSREEDSIPELTIDFSEQASGSEQSVGDSKAGSNGRGVEGADHGSGSRSTKTGQTLRRSITELGGSDPKIPGPAEIQHVESSPETEAAHQETKKEDAATPDMKAFLKQFWADKPEAETPPEILKVLNCSYRPKEKAGFLIPNLHGRLYTTADGIYFISWDGKNFSLPWNDIVRVEKEKSSFMGVNDNSLVVSYDSEGSESSFILGRLEARDLTLQHLRKLQEDRKARQAPQTSAVGDLPPVSPDAKMQEMTVVLSRMIKNTSIKQVYEKVWSEGIRTSEKPFYGPWLVAEECFEITVNDWEFAEPGARFVNPWCQEKYDQKRLVTFKFNRTSHLYIGPPVAFVKQMQYCRVEDNDKCVLAISATFEGIPYSDAFGVEMRWAGRRQGANDVQVEVALRVDFKKSTMLKSQIKAGTISETKNVHRRLFEAAKQVCSTPGSVQEEHEQEKEIIKEVAEEPRTLGTVHNFLSSLLVDRKILIFAAAAIASPVVWSFFSYMFGSRGGGSMTGYNPEHLTVRIDELQEEVRALQKSVDLVITLLKQKEQ